MVLSSPPPAEYALLCARVDAFAASVSARCADQLSCQRGCAGCCHVELTVSAVEAAALSEYIQALSVEDQRLLRDQLSQPRTPQPGDDPRCLFLDEQDACMIYSARPLVCRSQGLPLRYPTDMVPVGAVRTRLPTGVVTVCPLNFTDRAPVAGEILDAELVDQILAVLSHRHRLASGAEVQERWSLREILESATSRLR